MTVTLTETVTTLEVSEEVARGVALLDEKRPGWEHEIDLDKLDIKDPKCCVLGQVYGGFTVGYAEVGFTPDDDGTDAFAADDARCPSLTAEWRSVIETLRAERTR